jgi:hypothetical protein
MADMRLDTGERTSVHGWLACVSSAVILSFGITGVSPSAGQNILTGDYPTAARADYVFGCMAANGQTRLALDRCSCSIDTIAKLLPYDRYVQAETILSMRLVPGQASELFRTSPELKDIAADLRRAQAEAEIECFP